MHSDKCIARDVVRKLKKTTKFNYLNVDGTKILNFILEKSNGIVWTAFIWITKATTGKFLCKW